MDRKKMVVIASLFFLMPLGLRAEEPHESDKKVKAPRANAEKKKPATLAEKISACLAERPKESSKQEQAGSNKPSASVQPSETQQAASTAQNGAALFTQYCSKCHNQNELVPSEAANKVKIGEMPKAGEPQPSASEKQALIEYFTGKK